VESSLCCERRFDFYSRRNVEDLTLIIFIYSEQNEDIIKQAALLHLAALVQRDRENWGAHELDTLDDRTGDVLHAVYDNWDSFGLLCNSSRILINISLKVDHAFVSHGRNTPAFDETSNSISPPDENSSEQSRVTILKRGSVPHNLNEFL